MKIGDNVKHKYSGSVGIILETYEGCNMCVKVKFTDKEFCSILPAIDLTEFTQG